MSVISFPHLSHDAAEGRVGWGGGLCFSFLAPFFFLSFI